MKSLSESERNAQILAARQEAALRNAKGNYVQTETSASIYPSPDAPDLMGLIEKKAAEYQNPNWDLLYCGPTAAAPDPKGNCQWKVLTIAVKV